MQISDISQWMGRIAPLKADEAQAQAGLNQVDSTASAETAETSVTLKNQAYLRYLAHKYTMGEMTLHEWKNFQMEATSMGLIPMKSVLGFAKQIEHKVFRSNATEWLEENLSQAVNHEAVAHEAMPAKLTEAATMLEPKNMIFELGKLLKQPSEYTAKQQLKEWYALVQSVVNIDP